MNIDHTIKEIEDEHGRVNEEYEKLMKSNCSEFDKGLLVGMRSALRFTLAVIKSNRSD